MQGKLQVKLAKLVNSKGALEELIQEKLPTKPSYWISRVLGTVEEELQRYQKEKQKLFKKYSKTIKDETTGEEVEGINRSTKEWDAYIAEEEKLNAILVELPLDRLITIPESVFAPKQITITLPDGTKETREEGGVKPATLYALDYLIDIEFAEDIAFPEPEVVDAPVAEAVKESV